MNEKYSDILGFKKGEFAVFCGAGISKNSGLPLANELKRHILEKLPLVKEDIEEIMSSNLPFEAFMETLSENSDISKIFEIFENGRPNTNHILIARLARNGYLRTIFTTNFDLLIERALEKEGLKEGIDFERYYNEGHFSEIDFDNLNDKIKIYKIHGSADNDDSVRTTLRAVASKTLSDKRMNVIKYSFSRGRHKKVLILGYSCSDTFDITPQILSIAGERKEIIFVEHSNEEKIEIEDIKTKEYKNPFKKFLGKRIKCDTDKFIKDLWYSFEEIIGVYKPIKSKIEWKTYLDDWIKELENNKGIFSKYFMVGVVLHHISTFDRSIEYYKKSLEIAKEIGDKAKELKCYPNLGAAYGCLGDLETAIEYHKKSLEIAKSL